MWCAVVGFLAYCRGDTAVATDVLDSMFAPGAEPDLLFEWAFLVWPVAVRCAFDLGDLDLTRRLDQAGRTHPPDPTASITVA